MRFSADELVGRIDQLLQKRLAARQLTIDLIEVVAVHTEKLYELVERQISEVHRKLDALSAHK